ncbi:MAG: hypothetical protein ACM3MI_07875 [Clostridiales bacterium]
MVKKLLLFLLLINLATKGLTAWGKYVRSFVRSGDSLFIATDGDRSVEK